MFRRRRTLQKIHARIVFHISLHDHGLLSFRQTDSERRDGEGILIHSGQRSLVVIGLEGIAPALSFTVIIHIRYETLIVAGKAIFGSVIHHLIDCLLRDDAIGCSILENAEFHIISVAGKEQLLIAARIIVLIIMNGSLAHLRIDAKGLSISL